MYRTDCRFSNSLSSSQFGCHPDVIYDRRVRLLDSAAEPAARRESANRARGIDDEPMKPLALHAQDASPRE